MRSLLAVAVAGAVFASLSVAQAEQRIFVIASHSDAYGVDQCLASGARCGQAAANALCRSRAFAQALAFRRVAREDITGVVPNYGVACQPPACPNFIAIECTR